MSGQGLTAAAFPAFQRSVRARWAPVLLEPIAGSYERFVIGVAVVGERGFHLEMANALERLKCLYSSDAQGALYAVQLTAEHLRRDLTKRAGAALSDPKPAISGVIIGQCRDAEGESLEKIGVTWMLSLSSLYSVRSDEIAIQDVDDESDGQGDGGGDRLPALVMDYVRAKRQGYFQYFRADLRENKRRRLTGRSHEVLIDYSGSRLVANFGTLQVGGIARSVNLIKRRLWDLKVERDRDSSLISQRRHEMILQTPQPNDPQFSTRQYANLNEALQALEEQADQEELRLRTMHSVPQIGDHVLLAEAA